MRPAPSGLVPFIGEPVRRTAELAAVAILRTPAGEDVVDFGQVIAGRVRMRVRGPAGTEITLEHSETLNRDGNFFHNTAGVNKDQTDSYVVAGAPEGEDVGALVHLPRLPLRQGHRLSRRTAC